MTGGFGLRVAAGGVGGVTLTGTPAMQRSVSPSCKRVPSMPPATCQGVSWFFKAVWAEFQQKQDGPMIPESVQMRSAVLTLMVPSAL